MDGKTSWGQGVREEHMNKRKEKKTKSKEREGGEDRKGGEDKAKTRREW